MEFKIVRSHKFFLIPYIYISPKIRFLVWAQSIEITFYRHLWFVFLIKFIVTEVHIDSRWFHTNSFDQQVRIRGWTRKCVSKRKILEISRDVEEIGSRDARRSEYFPASVHGEARDSSTVTLIRARFRRRIRGTRVILVPTNPLPASFLSFLSSPVTFPPGMTRSRALDSVPWHYVVPHLLVCGSVTKPPPSPSSCPYKSCREIAFSSRRVIKAATFHVTSYLDLRRRLFLASGDRLNI